ncbi:hypothetical protein EVAR_59042_1 [Eumeta japonica]|uniref:Uncharacterized protein n=1 Tax=Eumeta variegata TaxID=151549 RepID=A0A4C1ZBT1_EUMVA|nr:hypothetical protein EVAR_59042_1 [Eumeta japonica]
MSPFAILQSIVPVTVLAADARGARRPDTMPGGAAGCHDKQLTKVSTMGYCGGKAGVARRLFKKSPNKSNQFDFPAHPLGQ